MSAWVPCVRASHREEPVAGVELLQLGPGEQGGVLLGAVGEHLVHVRGPPQGGVMHQEGNTVVTVDTRVCVCVCVWV